MASISNDDLLLLYREDAVSDALARVLNATSLGGLQRVGVIPRQLTQPPTPGAPEVKVWWERPTITLAPDEREPQALLSVPLHSGARNRTSQHIMTLSAEVFNGACMRSPPRLARNAGPMRQEERFSPRRFWAPERSIPSSYGRYQVDMRVRMRYSLEASRGRAVVSSSGSIRENKRAGEGRQASYRRRSVTV
jgi:hypothetical protein